MNLRSLLFRVALVTMLLGVAYVVSFGVRRSDTTFPDGDAAASATVLFPLVGLPLVHLLIAR